jgi:hypothetical protein
MTKSETFEQNSLGTQKINSMPIDRAANYHNVAGIINEKEYDVSPMILLLQCDVKLCQQVNLRGEGQRFIKQSYKINQ